MHLPATQDPGRIKAPGTVIEGGSVTIDVRTGAEALFVSIEGLGTVRIPVVDGVAEYRLPPTVRGGAVIFISDCKLPDPAGTTIHVVSNQ